MSRKPDPNKLKPDRTSPPQSQADRAAEDAPGDLRPGDDLSERQEKLIDEAVQETFPASDPIAPKRIT